MELSASRRRARGALLGLLSCACAAPSDDDLSARLAAARASCALIVLDAAAAGHFGALGYPRDTTPHVDRLAAEGVLFERAYSQAPSTVLSTPSYLSGLLPHTLGRLRSGKGGRPRYVSEAFAAAGFRTAAFVGNPVVKVALPEPAVFERFTQVPADERGGGAGSRALVEAALEWVEARRDERFFLYLHLLPPHGPYLPPEDASGSRGLRPDLVPDVATLEAIDRGEREVDAGDVAYLVSRYDAHLRYADSLVGELVGGLAALGALDRTLLILTSDHGEAFGEHGRFLHNSTLYDEMLRVPLVFRFPPSAGVVPRRVSEPVPLLDLVPTLAELFSLEAEGEALHARSLRALLQGGASPDERLLVLQNLESVGAVRGEFKLILGASGGELREELYQLSSDPGEKSSVAPLHPERVAGMRSGILALLDGSIAAQGLESAARTLSDEQRRQLESLGYLLERSRQEGEGAGR